MLEQHSASGGAAPRRAENGAAGWAQEQGQESGPESLSLTAVLAALADPGRLDIVRTLAERGEECCTKVGEAAGLAVGKSTLSHHLRVLRESGITRTRAQGTHRYISLRREDLDAAFPHLMDAVLSAAPGSAVVSR
jgi:DNA-binding transcriptional ArsR family regulator